MALDILDSGSEAPLSNSDQTLDPEKCVNLLNHLNPFLPCNMSSFHSLVSPDAHCTTLTKDLCGILNPPKTSAWLSGSFIGIFAFDATGKAQIVDGITLSLGR